MGLEPGGERERAHAVTVRIALVHHVQSCGTHTVLKASYRIAGTCASRVEVAMVTSQSRQNRKNKEGAQASAASAFLSFFVSFFFFFGGGSPAPGIAAPTQATAEQGCVRCAAVSDFPSAGSSIVQPARIDAWEGARTFSTLDT